MTAWSSQKTQPKIELTRTKGTPLPFGASFLPNGVNFALFSKSATSVTLCLFLPDEQEPFYTIPLDPAVNRTGDVWHIFVQNISEGLLYGYYIDGPYQKDKGFLFDKSKLLIDPYATSISNGNQWGTEEEAPLKGVLIKPTSFDWQNDKHPRLPMEDMIIYEMHVRGFTRDPSSGVSYPGTFLGLVEKIPYLKSLGVNAVELLPIHAFNECEYVPVQPSIKERLYNYWGYSTLNFFAPMNRYATDKHQSIREFKAMVAALHKVGIEVILDVVFNHTGERGENGPTFCFRGLENSTYYMLGPNGEYLNFSGCGNTFNCNHPVARELIRSSLRYWVSEMHVDGFRFDLASILGRSTDGTPLSSPPLIEMIALDPVLANTKLIAEAWDAAGLYQVGSFPSWGVWAEWNGKYRDIVRRFIKGDRALSGAFATAICGSADLYSNGRTPSHSINFITAHDGFSLADLVSYNQKHNLANGENNRDGSDQNDSWNCGIEGPTTDKDILALRERQMRNFLVALMVSLGVPMIKMGDEYAHTKNGNNNTWCQDNILSWFLWDQHEKKKDFFHFFSSMISFRKNHKILQRATFYSPEDICWHGPTPSKPDWGPDSQFVAYSLKDNEKGNDLYIAFNACNHEREVMFPTPPTGLKWYRIVDTQKKSPEDFVAVENSKPISSLKYKMSAYSSVILLAK